MEGKSGIVIHPDGERNSDRENKGQHRHADMVSDWRNPRTWKQSDLQRNDLCTAGEGVAGSYKNLTRQFRRCHEESQAQNEIATKESTRRQSIIGSILARFANSENNFAHYIVQTYQFARFAMARKLY